MKKKRLLLALPHQHVKKNLILRLAFMMISIFWVSGVVFAGSTGMGQQKKVSGTVTDDQGAVAGASVIIEGTTIGVITDNNGKFSLEYSKADAVLVISFVGYKTERIPIDGKTELNIQLVSQISELNDVVVIGYGTVKKRDLTGSVSSIKSTEIMKTASNNALQAMQGKIAGVDLTKNSGAAGSGVTVNLRGNRSISATNEPMFIVDGIEYGSVLDLNASDIESIDVLKDASSTAIYGSRGANGVIIITTKGGLLNGINARKSKVSINSYMSFNSPTNYPEKMNANQEYLMIAERMRYAAEKATSSWGSTKLSDYSPESVLSNVVSSPYDKSVYQIWKEGGIHPLDLVLFKKV